MATVSEHNYTKHLRQWRFVIYLFFLLIPGDKIAIDVAGFALRLSNILAILIFIFFLFYHQSFVRISRKFALFILLFGCTSTISFFLYPSSPVNLAYILQGLFNLIIYPMLINKFCRLIGCKSVLKIYINSCAAMSLYALLQVFASNFSLYDSFADQILPDGTVRASAFTYEPSSLAIYLVFPLIFLLHAFMLSTFVKQMSFSYSYFSLFIILFASFLTTSSTIILIVSLYFSYFLLRHGLSFAKSILRRTKLLIVMSSFLSFSFLYVVTILPDSFSKLGALANPMNHHSLAERFDMSYNAIYAFSFRPIWGFGFGGVREFLYSLYTSSDSHIILSPSRLFNDLEIELNTFQPMTILTELLSSLGTVGFLIILISSIYFYRSIFKTLGSLQYADKYDKILFGSLVVSSIFLLVSMQLSQGFFRLYVIVPLAILANFSHFYKVNLSK